MSERRVTVRLNQQQWELVDKTVADGVAPDRAALLRKALAEYWRDTMDEQAQGPVEEPARKDGAR